jgi:hypothetical protein
MALESLPFHVVQDTRATSETGLNTGSASSSGEVEQSSTETATRETGRMARGQEEASTGGQTEMSMKVGI